MKRWMLLLMVLFTSCMPGGCQQKVAEKVVEKTVEIQTGEKINIGTDVDLGELEDLVPSNAKITSMFEVRDSKQVAYVVKSSPNEVVNFYVEKLGSPSLKMTTQEGMMLAWEKKEIGVLINKGDEGTTVVLTKGGI
ncbi:MAG: hypothetical protein GXO39_05700 [Thermotogae bacterium]|nr:hypothetical protein [Thermotogota bacterium]